jgi:hypothetical protein
VRDREGSGRKKVNLFKSHYEEDLGGSILPNKMEKSDKIMLRDFSLFLSLLGRGIGRRSGLT